MDERKPEEPSAGREDPSVTRKDVLESMSQQVSEMSEKARIGGQIQAIRRERVIGFFVLAIVLSMMGWVMYLQQSSANDLRQRLYQSCVLGNQERAQTKQIYQDIAAVTHNVTAKATLGTAAAKLTPRDCAHYYLK